MKKIPCLFKRIFHDRSSFTLTEIVTPGCEWVLAGEGVATKKFDGSATLVKGGKLFKRYDAKHGKTPPPGWGSCGGPDAITGHNPGWIEVTNLPDEKWHIQAWQLPLKPHQLQDGTYELCGPKVGANKEKLDKHYLLRHGSVVYYGIHRTFEGLKKFLKENIIEGIVFHHDDGRMCKIRRNDFGFNW